MKNLSQSAQNAMLSMKQLLEAMPSIDNRSAFEKIWDYISIALCGNQKNLFRY